MPRLAPDGFPIPPERLIRRAGSTPGADVVQEYLAGAAGMKAMLMDLVDRFCGPAASEHPRILDFGCGGGNVLRHFAGEAQAGEVWGCDIDPQSIEWLKENLSPPFRFFLTGESRQLPQPDGYFDLIYAISVFTHLADDWAVWLSELHRTLRPSGIVMATFLGEGMAEAERAGPWDPDRFGMNVLRHGQNWDGGGPTVFLSDWWIRAHWGRAFEILDIHHDRDGSGAVVPGTHGYVVMRKREIDLAADQLAELEPGEPREIQALQHNIAQLHADDHHLRGLLSAAVQEARAADEEVADLREQLEIVSRSRSWRLTRPLRMLAQSYRQHLR